MDDRRAGHLLGGVEGLCAGQDVASERAAAFGPFVVLRLEHVQDRRTVPLGLSLASVPGGWIAG